MQSYSDICEESVRSFILEKGGKVTNQELVKHFKSYLTDPTNREESRKKFKEIVNSVAVGSRDKNGQKYLSLRKTPKYPTSPTEASSPSFLSSSSIQRYSVPSPGASSTSSFTASGYENFIYDDQTPPPLPRQPPPYREPPPPPPLPPASRQSFDTNPSKTPPAVPPRRKSSDKVNEQSKVIISTREDGTPAKEASDNESQIKQSQQQQTEQEAETERKVSVKECLQKFNKMASEQASLPKWQQPITSISSRKRLEKVAGEKEDDSSSVHSYDPKLREWLVRASQGNYQELAKLSSENPKLAKYKDPSNGYTALHWGAKHGNTNIIKLIAGAHGVDVNIRTHGGYTPLHIAMQHGHEDVYNLLVQVYGADQNLRDWSGRKPRQYQPSRGTSLSTAMLNRMKSQKKHSEKDSGFLRIGSLNVRVKKTTEAFSNFLGVGQSSSDKIHKHWGSADNIEDYNKMPPPKSTTIKKRKSKGSFDFRKSPLSSPRIRGKSKPQNERSDSDSDSASGFDANWRRNT